LEHRASNPVSVKNLTAVETSTIVKLLRPYVPVGTKRTIRRRIGGACRVNERGENCIKMLVGKSERKRPSGRPRRR
jgi:hypothetical protein